jgi:flagellar hook protein FlgE
MSFQQGLSGLSAASKNIEVLGNNIANASTVGFKQSRAEFADMYASSLAGTGDTQAGIGARVNEVSQQFGQGSVTTTGNAMDVAINGNGFFRLTQNGAVVYSRNGQFQVDANNYIVNADGLNVTGYPADRTTGLILAGSTASSLQLDTADQVPRVTSSADITANFDSRVTTLPPAAFNFNDPTTYHSATTVQVFDSLGNPHNLSMFFLKNAANSWQVRAQLDGAAVAGGAPIGTGLNFTSAGAIDTVTTTLPFNVSFPLTNGAATPQAVSVNFANATQYGANFGVTGITQNGYTSGRLVGYNISSDGVINGRYSNGQTRAQGQIVMASFINNQGLQPLGGNVWSETRESGSPAVGAPKSGLLGTLQSSAVEESNVDLTADLVNMITAQRVFQANAQTIRTQDSLLQTIIQLR